MENQNIEVNLSGDQKELTIITRTGQAEEIFKPNKVILAGTLDAPFEYFSKRLIEETINLKYTHLKVNYEDKVLVLVVDEHKNNGVEVTGRVRISKEFERLGINTSKQYDMDELREAIKFMGVYFKSREAHVKLMGNLVNYKIKINQDFQNSQDFKGSQATSKATQVKHDIPLDFELNIPVILGQANEDIKVEVCLDASNGSLVLWLECIELKSRMDKKIADLIEVQVKSFEEKIVKIITG